jgi:hypothetical protein
VSEGCRLFIKALCELTDLCALVGQWPRWLGGNIGNREGKLNFLNFAFYVNPGK